MASLIVTCLKHCKHAGIIGCENSKIVESIKRSHPGQLLLTIDRGTLCFEYTPRIPEFIHKNRKKEDNATTA